MTRFTTVLGGADGPTSVFIAGNLGMGWFNIYGMVYIILLLIPNIIYAVKNKEASNKCTNKFMNMLEQVGRYGCMFFMMIHVGFGGIGFKSVSFLFIYFIVNFILMLAYWIIWMFYFIKPGAKKQLLLAILPTIIFITSGITMSHYLLLATGILFGVGHIYVTIQNKID